MMLKLAIVLSRHGWTRLSAVALDLDLWLSGLGRASRDIKRARRQWNARTAQPPRHPTQPAGLPLLPGAPAGDHSTIKASRP
jgi:hypothetical protein